MLSRIHSVLTNFWLALSLAILSLFCAVGEYLEGNTGWVIANIIFATYWLVIAWRASRRTEYHLGSEDNELTQDDIDTMVRIRDNMTSLIAKEQAKLDAKEKDK